MSFLTNLLEHTSIYESPTAFWKWAGYATIAATLRDNCFIQQGSSFLFPNIYVLLLATSGIQRKNRPVELSENLLTALQGQTKIISGRTSIQAILDELNQSETSKSGKITKGGSAIFYAPELTAGIVSDPVAVGVLTDIYDYKSEFKHNLRSTGKIKIEKIVFSMLAASNEELLKDVYDSRALKGGLLARTFLVIPDEFRKSNSLLRGIDITESYKRLVDSLKEVAGLRGKFIFTEDAINEYDNWYMPYRDSLREKNDKTGVFARLHTGVVKLSMVLAANDLSLTITRAHIELAINECLALLPNYQSFMITGGKGTLKEAGAILLQRLLDEPTHRITRKVILRDHWYDIEGDLLDKLLITLEQGGLIQTINSSDMGGQLIVMTEKCISIMRPKVNTVH